VLPRRPPSASLHQPWTIPRYPVSSAVWSRCSRWPGSIAHPQWRQGRPGSTPPVPTQPQNHEVTPTGTPKASTPSTASQFGFWGALNAFPRHDDKQNRADPLRSRGAAAAKLIGDVNHHQEAPDRHPKGLAIWEDPVGLPRIRTRDLLTPSPQKSLPTDHKWSHAVAAKAITTEHFRGSSATSYRAVSNRFQFDSAQIVRQAMEVLRPAISEATAPSRRVGSDLRGGWRWSRYHSQRVCGLPLEPAGRPLFSHLL
jgi:hypothetical protein